MRLTAVSPLFRVSRQGYETDGTLARDTDAKKKGRGRTGQHRDGICSREQMQDGRLRHRPEEKGNYTFYLILPTWPKSIFKFWRNRDVMTQR